ncbi:NADH-quinone oxidoreductase subunit L [Coprobacter tertius]|uniref:NADH-quinone oxidoreductase subunit L n=1 Tax=Coprobacter tertius TaxID=2944915 RepID=A0ABT1MIJ6_9BACT|nr:NADH-quinone oxidoreductase subunit L [Coprobacter tertius]MCP9611528.1 NADH-quinone oxidoreductase subunit L [Coprobacter tertius]
MEYTFIILLLPLVMFLLLGLCGHRMSHRTAGLLGTTGLGVITVLAYVVAYQYFSLPRVGADGGVYPTIIPFNFEWLRFTDSLHIDLGILLDPISVMMLVVITTISFMVHLYSIGYMHGEKGFQRYFAFLSLFSFSMLGLVVATNIFQMYIFWELVGASSYLLIGFYYTKASAVSASKKAFIVTRFADLGFLVGILILSFFSQTFDFQSLTTGNPLASMAGKTFLGLSVASWAMALIFMGGAGKSAMFPLHIWLPDAMEGPTPVSALIHAATMVVAGVYLVARLFPVYSQVPEVLDLITYVGAFTALYAAVVACVQTDIKRVLAFSTISQIAFMMVALGVASMSHGLGYMASMFHLFTHAMFKALLFLGAGAIIHAVHSNEMSSMGGLRKYMPLTHITFLIACLAIAGIPPFSGFFSKDEILAAAFDKSMFWGIWMTLVAGLTAFYMFRLYYNIFWGKEAHHEHTPHEAPKVMVFPLMFLALVTCVAGFIPFGEFVTSNGLPYHIHLEWSVAGTSVVVALIGILVATWMYKTPNNRPARMAASMSGLYKWAYHRFYIDEVYQFITHKIIFNGICSPIAWFDRHVIDGSMNGLAWITQKVSYGIRGLQSGQLQWYAWVFLAGAVIIALLVICL